MGVGRVRQRRCLQLVVCVTYVICLSQMLTCTMLPSCGLQGLGFHVHRVATLKQLTTTNSASNCWMVLCGAGLGGTSCWPVTCCYQRACNRTAWRMPTVGSHYGKVRQEQELLLAYLYVCDHQRSCCPHTRSHGPARAMKLPPEDERPICERQAENDKEGGCNDSRQDHFQGQLLVACRCGCSRGSLQRQDSISTPLHPGCLPIADMQVLHHSACAQ
jgi:hypothetical protein